ncbi:MAG: hypothetical protein WCV58_03105 [Patescibacteria group bacterium]|jgi:hypothetical protein
MLSDESKFYETGDQTLPFGQEEPERHEYSSDYEMLEGYNLSDYEGFGKTPDKTI